MVFFRLFSSNPFLVLIDIFFLVSSECFLPFMLAAVLDLDSAEGLKPRGLIGAAFGSYGWSGEAVGQITEALAAMKVELVADGIKVKYVPDEESLSQCWSVGREIAERLSAKA